MVTEFEVNIDSILASANYLGTMGSRVGTIEGELKNIAKIALIDTFEEAVVEADFYDGFPSEFQNHTMNVIRNFQSFYVIYDGFSVFISVDFENLGTQEELRKAFHQGAKLADGGYLWGPYEGQALISDSKDSKTSHEFWEAIRFQRDYYNETTGKTVPTSYAPYQWDKIVNKYVEIWGTNKCPEWLFIQFGQEEFEPVVPQFDIIGEFETRFYSLCEELLVTFVNAEIRQAEAYESVGATVGFTVRGQPRLRTGSFVNPATGKTIRPGQFAPKL